MTTATDSSEAQLQIRFITKQEQYAVADVPFSVPANIECPALDTLVNELIKENRSDEWKHVEFDFLVCGEFLRVPLLEHLQERSVSTEVTVDVEYVERHPSPEPQDCLMHDDWVSAVHATDKWILTGCYDNTINIWTVKGKHKLAIQDHTALVKSVAWIHIDETSGSFVSASHDQTAMLWHWDVQSNKAECRQVCRGHERGVDCVAVSPNGDTLATGSWDTMLKLWSASMEDTSEGEPISKRMRGDHGKVRTPLHTLKGHKEDISSVVWTANDTVCTASMDHTIKLWDAELCGIRSEIVGNKSFFHADHSPLNKLLITASADRHVRLYDPRSQEGSVVKSTFTSHSKWVQTARWSKTDEHLFISGSHDHQVKLWDTRSPKAPLFDLSGHERQVLCADWSNPKYMISGGADNTVHIFKSKKAPAKRTE